MLRLFIIGNGFDLAHGLPTRYEDFHNFLRVTYPNASEDEALVPEFSLDHHGEQMYNIDEVVGYWMNVLSRAEGEQWTDFESSLGKLSFDDDFDMLPPQYDRDGDLNPWHEAYNNEDLAAQIAGCAHYLSGLFSQWINSICITSVSAKESFKKFILPDDLFINFNYTQVLEQVYKISPSNVCHIHGTQGEEIVFGHGEGRRYNEEYGSPYIGCEDGLEYIQNLLRKDTAKAINQHQSFFQKLDSGLSSIFSYGFSFSPVDEVYIKEICDHADTSGTVWLLHSYDSKKHTEQQETIRRCGFQGHFSVF